MIRAFGLAIWSASAMGLMGSFLCATTTEPGQETVWDQMMAAQAYRDMRAGSEHMELRQYDRAVREFAKAVLARPNDPEPHLMLGAAYYWSGQVESASDEFRQALRLDPRSAQGHLLMGIIHAWKGDVESAYRSFLEAERYDARRPDIQMNLGSVEETLGLYPQALEHFRRAVGLEPQNPLYHYQLGMLYSRLGRNLDAADSLRRAIDKHADFEDAILELGGVLERQGRVAEAQDMFRRAVRLKSRDAVARLRFGRTLLAVGKPEKAREAFREAFHVTPDQPGGGLALSVSFGGDPSQGSSGGPASPGSDASLPSRPNEPRQGAAQEGNADPKDPLDVVARNLERIPLDQEAQLTVEMAFLPRPQLVRAKPTEPPSSLKRALEEAGRPPRPSAMGVKREFRFQASDGDQRKAQIHSAVAELREVMRQAPADAQVRLGMQLQYTPKKFSDIGRADASQPPKVSYQPRQIGNDMGLWVVGTGWMALVEEVLPEGGEPPAHPDHVLWWVADGLGYASLGNGAMALAAFDRALQADPKEETALLGRAVALIEMGRDDEAMEAYRHLVALYPKNRAAKDGLAWLLRTPGARSSR